jgi:hypothetical protein
MQKVTQTYNNLTRFDDLSTYYKMSSNFYVTSVPIFKDAYTLENYYQIDGHRYHMNFPISWAVNHKSWVGNPNTKSGPKHCYACMTNGSVGGAFLWYCKNCMKFIYEGTRIPSMEGINENDYPVAFHEWEFFQDQKIIDAYYPEEEVPEEEVHEEQVPEEQNSVADEHLDEYDVIYYARKQSRREQPPVTREPTRQSECDELWSEIAKELSDTKAYQQLEDDLCL